MTSQTSIARVELPWPPKDVSPNARGHRMTKVRATKAYRDACGWECVAQNVSRIDAERIHATITYHAPDNRHRDLDNLLASSKAAIDAVSEMIGVDDSKWSIAIVRANPKLGQGAIVMELEAA